MNIRLFIAEVKKRKALWDQSSRHYHNKKALSDGWRDIAKMFNVEVIVAKQKWKNLRDTFRVELKKTKRYSGLDSSDSVNSRSLWAYYEDMFFLKDILRTRRVGDYSDIPTPSEISENINENVKIENDTETAPFSPAPNAEEEGESSSNFVIGNVTSLHPQNDDVDTTHDQNKKTTRKRKSNGDHGEGNDDDQDDDLLFFRSLLPFVKRLDQDKKLLFRMNVQQMLYNQLYSN